MDLIKGNISFPLPVLKRRLIYAATLTAYPDPDPETTTVDGRVGRSGSNLTWNDLVTGNGTVALDNDSPTNLFYTEHGSTTDRFVSCNRFICLFLTSAIGVGGTITAAILSFYGQAKADAGSDSPNADVYTSSPASNTSLAIGDYQTMGSTSQTGSPVTYASWSTTAYNDLTFNATGIGNITKDGVSKFGGRNANLDVANQQPTWVSGNETYLNVRTADAAGTTQDPKLVVTYTAAAGGDIFFGINI